MAKIKLNLRGSALFAKLKTPDSYNGSVIGYTIQVYPSDEDYERMKAQLMQVIENAKGDDEFKGKQWLSEPVMGIVENRDGEYGFKFKKKHQYIDKKTGDVVKTNVPVFDRYGSPTDVEVGNGSEVVIAFSAVPFHMTKNNNGVSLRLEAVQVVNLKERPSGGAQYYGFTTDKPEAAEMFEVPF